MLDADKLRKISDCYTIIPTIACSNKHRMSADVESYLFDSELYKERFAAAVEQ